MRAVARYREAYAAKVPAGLLDVYLARCAAGCCPMCGWEVRPEMAKILDAGTRESVVLDPAAGSDTGYLGVGDPAVVGKGLALTAGRPIVLTGADARKALYVIADTGDTSSGGIQES